MSDHKLADALGVRVWELKFVPTRYIEERAVMLQADFEARCEVAAALSTPKQTVRPDQVMLPEF